MIYKGKKNLNFKLFLLWKHITVINCVFFFLIFALKVLVGKLEARIGSDLAGSSRACTWPPAQ